ncbi:MAG: YhbY family RNA-binding protein [Proteobacteria bacterium]|nr:YhbY family RNA-binding protein [Pseudomonadota bacterium]
MHELKGFQRKYLRGLAHDLEPVVYIGQNGITEAVEKSINEALDAHELIKLKFIEFKKKEQKDQISQGIEERTGCAMVGIIGHVAIFYRRHSDVKKRRIRVPVRED